MLTEPPERSEQGYIRSIYFVQLYVGLEEFYQAFAWLDKAYEGRDYWMIYLNVDPAYDSIRSDPRFGALLDKIKPE